MAVRSSWLAQYSIVLIEILHKLMIYNNTYHCLSEVRSIAFLGVCFSALQLTTMSLNAVLFIETLKFCMYLCCLGIMHVIAITIDKYSMTSIMDYLRVSLCTDMHILKATYIHKINVINVVDIWFESMHIKYKFMYTCISLLNVRVTTLK